MFDLKSRRSNLGVLSDYYQTITNIILIISITNNYYDELLLIIINDE